MLGVLLREYVTARLTFVWLQFVVAKRWWGEGGLKRNRFVKFRARVVLRTQHEREIQSTVCQFLLEHVVDVHTPECFIVQHVFVAL